MGRLAASFPEPARRKFIARNLTPGRVLYLHCGFTRPAPKDKYLLLASYDTPPLLFVINSGISRYIQSKPHLLSCQVPLKVSDYSFLSHDSYVDCSEVINCIDKGELEDQLLASTERIKGEVDQATKSMIVKVVGGAKTVSPKHKRLILAALA
jgi:hypothetical protein